MSTSESLLVQMGFRFGRSGTHASRTLMLEDLRALLDHTQPEALRDDYAAAVVEQNVLGKPSRRARELALLHLRNLYCLDAAFPAFRMLRRLWPANRQAQPLIALSLALARDPILRSTWDSIVQLRPSLPLEPRYIEDLVKEQYQERFSPATLRATAQNLAHSWRCAGFLTEKPVRTRTLAPLFPESFAMLLFLGFLEGRTGNRLFSSRWISLATGSPDDLEALAAAASNQGFLLFMNSGGVKEIRFPDFMSPDEDIIRQEISHVV